MLNFLRRAVKSWVAKGLLALLILSFAVWGISDIFTGGRDFPVAQVGEREVSSQALAEALYRQRIQLSQSQGRAISFDDMRAAGVDRLLLARLIRDAAFAEELDRIGISAPDAAVERAIRTNEAFLGPGGAFSESNYRLTLGRLGFTPSEFEGLTRTLVAQQMLETAAAGPTAVPPGLAARIAAQETETRRISTLALPIDGVEAPADPDDASLASYFEENRERYREPERRSGMYVHVDIAALAEEESPAEGDVEGYYEENGALFSVAPTRTIDQLPLGRTPPDDAVRQALEGEIPFESLAIQLGEDPGALSLGEVERGDLPEAIGAAVFEADAPGLVGPIEGPAGFVLVRIRAVRAGGVQPLEAVRDDIAATLAQDRALERAPDIANQIDDLRAAGNTVAEIAEGTGLPLLRFDGLARDGSLADGSAAEGVAATPVFLDEVLAALDHEERDLVELPDGGYLLAVVERIQESDVPALDAVRDRVLEDWRAAERLARLLEDGEAVAARISGPETLSDIAVERELEVIAHEPFPRGGAPRDLPRTLAADVFSLDEGEATARPLVSGDVVVIAEVEEILPGAPDALAELSEQAEAVIAAQIADDSRELFARAIQSSHGGTIDEGAIERVFQQIGAGHRGAM